MFFDGLDAYFKYPKDANTSTIFSGGLWMGGIRDGNLKVAARTYGNLSGQDYWAGYIGDGIGVTSTNRVNKVWKIKRNELRDFLNDIEDGSLSRPIPYDILTWPAIGNPHFEIYKTSYTINQPLADFVDVNSDGIYNAYDGDYPVMKGDEMLWWVFNDSKDIHSQTTGDPVEADIVAMAYGYDCPTVSHLYNTLFVEFQITNQASTTIDSFFAGFWTDIDLGCYTDDFIGSDSTGSYYYSYNQTPTDASCNFPNSPQSYGNNVPVQSVLFLDNSMDNFIYYQNAGLSQNPALSDPSTANEYYHYLNANWRDGTPLTVGGDGYQQNSQVTNYAFSGNPANNSEWSMCTSSIGSDFRSIGSSGPHTLQAGEQMTLKLAFTIQDNIMLPCPDVSTIRSSNNQVQADFTHSNANNNHTLDWIPNLGTDRTIDNNTTLILNPNNSNNIYTYQWSTGANTNTIDITTPGLYSVTMTDYYGCEKTDEINILNYTNTVEQEEIFNFKVFPNPVDKILNIELEDYRSNLTLQLVNVLGQQTVTEQLISSNSFSLDVSHISSGVYFLNIWDRYRVLKTVKVVVE